MEEITILTDLTIIFGLAVGVILLCHRFNVPSLVGLLITGTLVGPYGLKFIADPHVVEILAEIGIILLLFVIGMEFSLERLSEIRTVILFGGTFQVLVTGSIVAGVCYYLGWTPGKSVFFGSLAALSSTAIVIKLIQTNALLDKPHGLNSLGILIYQDIMIVPLLLLAPVLAGQTPDFTRDAIIQGGLGLLVGLATIVLARWAVPRLLQFVVNLHDREIMLLTVVFLVLGICWITFNMGLSLSLGAFVSGLIVSESEHTHHVMENILPFRDVFTGLFFVSVGMSMNPDTLLNQPVLIGSLTLIILLLKTVVAGLSVLTLGYGLASAFLVGLMLNQIGEFSLLLARVGFDHGLITPMEHQVFLTVTILTMILTPFEFELVRFFETSSQTSKDDSDDRFFDTETLKNHLIIVGYGPVGKAASKEMESLGKPYVVVELNPMTVEKERQRGRPILYGDASREPVLREAGISEARALLVATGETASALEVAEIARVLRPDLELLVRTRYESQVDSLEELEVNDIITDEDSVADTIKNRLRTVFTTVST